jgi:hypothetical protein
MSPKKQKRPHRSGAGKAFRGDDYLLFNKAAQAIIFEATIVAVAASALADGTLTENDRQRALLSVPRIHVAIDVIRRHHDCYL